MVEPLHAKKPNVELEEPPTLSPEKAAARKRNTVALMRAQGWDFPDQPAVPAPAPPPLPLKEARSAVAERIDQLGGWLKVRADLEADLSATREQQKRALGDTLGNRDERTERIAEAQIKERVLSADLEHHATSEKPLVDALCSALEGLRLPYERLYQEGRAERLRAVASEVLERLGTEFAVTDEELYAIASRSDAVKRLEALHRFNAHFASEKTKSPSADFLSLARRFLAEVERVTNELGQPPEP
jgi:hypothetical protein